MKPQEIINQKRQQSADKKQKGQEIDDMGSVFARKLRDELMMLGSPAVMSSPDAFTERIGKLNEVLSEAIEDVNNGTSTIEDVFTKAMTAYKALAEKQAKDTAQQSNDVAKSLSETVKLLKTIKTSPVTLAGKPFDTASLERSIKTSLNAYGATVQSSIQAFIQSQAREDVAVEQTDTIDLASYKAHDLKDDGDLQYVGFVNPNGGWYIIENQVRENKMRYIFGSGGYDKAFSNAASWNYKILSEATNEA